MGRVLSGDSKADSGKVDAKKEEGKKEEARAYAWDQIVGLHKMFGGGDNLVDLLQVEDITGRDKVGGAKEEAQKVEFTMGYDEARAYALEHCADLEKMFGGVGNLVDLLRSDIASASELYNCYDEECYQYYSYNEYNPHD